jgi:hypothetical protein
MSDTFIPFGEWAPDRAVYQNPMLAGAGFTHIATNVVPATSLDSNGFSQVTYGPFASPVEFTPPLSSPCQGAFTYVDSSSDSHIFAGNAHDLLELTAASTTFSVVSKTPAAYTSSQDIFWSFTNFSDTVIATNFNDPVQALSIGSGSGLFADLAAAAPRAKFAAVVKDFVVLGYTNDVTSGTRGQRVWWSAIGDPTNWPEPGSITATKFQSDFNEVPGDFGNVTGLIPNLGKWDCVIFFERAIWGMSYVGAPGIFSFYPIAVRGTTAPNSIVQVDGICFFLGEQGWYSFDGATVTPIGYDRVDAYTFSNLSRAFTNRTSGVADPESHNIYWIYCSKGNSVGYPDKCIVFNYALNKWSSAEMSGQFLFRALTFGKTLEGIGTLYPDIETVPYSFDSGVWSGTGFVMACFDLNNAMCYLNGPPLIPLVETPLIQIGDGPTRSTDTRSIITDARPAYDGPGCLPTIAISATDVLSSPLTLGLPVPANVIGSCPQRVGGRYFTAQLSLSVPSNFTHLTGVELQLVQAGRR